MTASTPSSRSSTSPSSPWSCCRSSSRCSTWVTSSASSSWRSGPFSRSNPLPCPRTRRRHPARWGAGIPAGASTDRLRRAGLHREQPTEERAIAAQGQAKLLGRELPLPIQRGLELLLLVGEDRRELLDHLGDELVGGLDRLPWRNPEAGLDLLPPAAVHGGVLIREERGRPGRVAGL